MSSFALAQAGGPLRRFFNDFTPKSVSCLRSYNRTQLIHDVTAGLTVGLVALPLAMAFAIASGVPPEAGLYCAVVAGFLISALGGSRTQIGGPTGAFVVVVSGIVAKHGLDGLMMCTLLAGVLLIVLGVTRMGTVIQFIPRPVVIGFTNGIAVLIASTQIKDFFGLTIEKVPGEFVHRVEAIASHWRTLDPVTTSIAAASLAAIVLLRRISPRIPATVIALFGATAIAWAMGLRVDTIQTRFGGIPSGLPSVHIPSFRPDLILSLLSPAITVAMLGAIESLLGRSRGPDDRRPAQPQHGTGRARCRERLLSAGRRAACHRRNRPDSHQHPLRRADTRGGDGPRGDSINRSFSSERSWPVTSRWACSRRS